ncbi:hypothetical protein NM208_g6045 [Fusarium decemcellulare]|uniref:Uncharacterized protein n=1 Tax=Fusarium decemcellulare TaxID=57161 RepID=A0ACC1SER3_9HYPO|nr:hypothetical protein NM208_g6045 [Fusarium decemcellulare]
MRQWGSSLDHNGMSFFPATIPEGVALYHGTHQAEAITGTQWLAFEIEHAEFFAGMENFKSPEPQSQHPMAHPDRGYLHIYQTTRPQRLLYIDGMAGAKTQMGTLDTQDILLRNRTGNLGWDEWGRAAELCKMAQQWRIDGFIRMEAGFEIIKCNFSEGMELISANQRSQRQQDAALVELEIVRAIAQRYWDIGASRVTLDFSRTVSAFFYPINLTNPKSAFAEQPRLVYPGWRELAQIKSDLRDVILKWRPEVVPTPGANWQGITDIIASRYAKRLGFMAEKANFEALRFEVESLLDTFIDFSDSGLDMTAAANQCTMHFLSPVKQRTEADRLIWAALKVVTSRICGALFTVRDLVTQESNGKEGGNEGKARAVIKDLIKDLRWPEWKECGFCESDRVCYVPMWPNGRAEDHYSPRCLNGTELEGREGYWD